MRIPESWLRSFANPALDGETLAERLTMAGLEVDDVSPVAPEFSGVVLARVVSVVKHPDADRLSVCSVDVGRPEPLQIVCGAPNVRANMIVACALEGAALPQGFKIKRAKMRGVESQGMLCSSKELGMSEEAEGIMECPASLAGHVGEDLRKVLELDARIFTFKLTPNRADCLSVLGIAREVSALTGAELKAPGQAAVSPAIKDRLSAVVQARDLCGRFTGRVIKGVNASAKTPDWMRTRLEQSGQRPISALVDISNYVMLESGQPNHVFDLAKIAAPLEVRWAKAGEKLLLLNDQEVTLDSSVGIIADAKGPLSLAGVMGGALCAVGNSTRDIFIEAAFWLPDAIRGRAKRYGFSTEAGHRFERGVDWEKTVSCIERLTDLICSVCGGEPGPVDDQRFGLPDRKPVAMRIERCNKILGIRVGQDECLDIFKRLGFSAKTVSQNGQSAIVVTPPSYRFDIEIEEDLIEEVARVYGFEKIPSLAPRAELVMAAQPEARRSAMNLRDRLVDADYVELVTYSFVPEDITRQLSDDPPLALINPMASHQSVMRVSLLPGLLLALRDNLNRKQERVRIFEIGRTFHDDPRVAAGEWTVKGIDQPVRIAGLACGFALEEQWGEPARTVDFFDLKADLEKLVAPLALATRKPSVPIKSLHPGRSAEVIVGGKPVGILGELNPAIAQGMGISQTVVVFELLVAPLLEVGLPVFSEVSRFPSVVRDLAVVVAKAVPAGQVLERLSALKTQLNQGNLIQNVKCFDEYTGKGLSDKEKSLAFRFILQSSENTLQDSEVDALMAKALDALVADFSARLRG